MEICCRYWWGTSNYRSACKFLQSENCTVVTFIKPSVRSSEPRRTGASVFWFWSYLFLCDVVKQMPTMLILSRQRSCDRGQFAFKFFPQCEGKSLTTPTRDNHIIEVSQNKFPLGIVGAVFDYRDADNFLLFEMGATFSRLRQKLRGSFQTLGKTSLWSLAPGEWNHIKISIYSSNVVINAGKSEKGFPVFNVSRTKGTINQFHISLGEDVL